MAKKRYSNRLVKSESEFPKDIYMQIRKSLKTRCRIIKRMKKRLDDSGKRVLSAQIDDKIFTMDKDVNFSYDCVKSPKGKGKSFKEGRLKALNEYLVFSRVEPKSSFEYINRLLKPKVINGHSAQYDYYLGVLNLNHE